MQKPAPQLSSGKPSAYETEPPYRVRPQAIPPLMHTQGGIANFTLYRNPVAGLIDDPLPSGAFEKEKRRWEPGRR